MMRLVGDKDDRQIPLSVLLTDFEDGGDPGVIMIITLDFLGKFDDNFGDMLRVKGGFPAQKVCQKYLRGDRVTPIFHIIYLPFLYCYITQLCYFYLLSKNTVKFIWQWCI